MPVTQVALASGFASVRRFNAAFAQHYGLNPTALRRSGRARPGRCRRIGHAAPGLPATAGCGQRCWPFLRSASSRGGVGGRRGHPGAAPHGAPAVGAQCVTGWLAARFDTQRHLVLLDTSESLHPVLPQVIARVRAMLDLDADPAAINAVLHGDFPERRRPARARRV